MLLDLSETFNEAQIFRRTIVLLCQGYLNGLENGCGSMAHSLAGDAGLT